jgi:cobalamin-dependent methionine synthase I
MEVVPELKSGQQEKPMRFDFRFSELKISKSQIIEALSESNGLLPGLFLDYIDEIVLLAEEGCQVSGYVRICSETKLNGQSGTLEINDEEFQISRIIAAQIQGSTNIAVFVCTAGSFLEEYARQQMKLGNYPEAFIADHMGSLVVETAIDKIQGLLGNELLTKKLKITNRFSPGYCGWNVSEQHKLFKLLPTGECGIRLTDSSLMQPIKSISGIIGIGEGVKYKQYACNLCNMKECIYRRRKKHV